MPGKGLKRSTPHKIRHRLGAENHQAIAAALTGTIPPATFTFILLLSLTATLIPGYTQETQTPPTQRTQQYADAKPRTRTSHPHIAYSDDTFTITLTGCEENEKQHWSCKYETPDGQEHWMYIPNFKPKHVTTSKP